MKPRAIIEHHADGWTETFSNIRIDFHHVSRPHAHTPAAGIKVDKVVDLMLPRRFDGIREPGNRRSWYMPAKVSIADLLQLLAEEEIWSALTKLGKDIRNGEG